MIKKFLRPFLLYMNLYLEKIFILVLVLFWILASGRFNWSFGWRDPSQEKNSGLEMVERSQTNQSQVKVMLSGGELLEIRLLDNHLLDTFGSKSTALHEIDQLLQSS